jgi:serine protease inhibitor
MATSLESSSKERCFLFRQVEVVQAYKFIQFTRQLMRAAGLVKYDFDIANRVYFDAAEPVRQCMRDIFDEDLVTADFAHNDTEARLNINQWVEQLTQGKIQDLATPDIINSQTRMAIVSFVFSSI